MNKTRAEIAEEKKQWAMKHFDYADNPVKEWIASLLNRKPIDVFPDYKEESEFVGTENESQHYIVYLSCEKNDDQQRELIKQEKIARAACIMFEAVYTVYNPIVQCMSVGDKEKLSEIFPKFDENEMCFYFSMVNKHDLEKKQAQETCMNCITQQERLNSADLSSMTAAQREEVEKLRQQLITLHTTTLQKLNSINETDVELAEKRCAEFNAVTHPKLYISVEHSETVDTEQILKRLPAVGKKYEDPEEYIDPVNILEKLEK